MQNKLILCMTLLFVGCATTDKPVINTVIQRAEIPIDVPCKAQIPDAPVFSFGKLTEDQNIFEKNKVLLSDRNLHLGYETELLTALKACVK